MNLSAYFGRYAQIPERLLIGLMSGTSVDGVDAALVRISGSRRETKATLERFHTHPFPPELRTRVLALSHGEGNAAEVSAVSVAVAQLFADAAKTLVRLAQRNLDEVDAIASHGQTVSHTPQHYATLQLGNPAVLSQQTGCVVVSDFRSADLAAFGQGAPLVPFADWCLLTDFAKSRAIQNIGGIGNVTYLPQNAAADSVLGFDTGPGNMLIDRAVGAYSEGQLRYDAGGVLAAAGSVDYALLDALLRHPFLEKRPPKSAGREEFGEALWRDIVVQTKRTIDVDVIATVTAFTAVTIYDAYSRFLPRMPDEVIVGGGGARNPTLMRMLQEKFGAIPLRTHESVGIDSDAKEAIAFCVLANETLLGNSANLPSVTGARRPVTLGSITLP